MKKSSKVISTLLLGATLTTMSMNVFAVESQETIKAKLLAGNNRYETAIEVSKHGWEKAETAVLVNAYALPDALAATPLAKMKDAPILLTEQDKLSDSTKAELERLAVKNVIIVGGEGVVSKEVVKTLEEMKIGTERVSGVDRIATALEVAKKVGSKQVAVVNGREGLADALSVAAPAAREGISIVLSNKDNLGATEEYIKENKIEKAYVVGGEGVVSKEVEEKLPEVERLAGADRNETNAQVLNKFYTGEEVDNIYIAKDGKANTSELVDALAIGPVAGKENSPVILAGAKLSEGQAAFLNGKKAKDVYQIGGGINADTVEAIVKALDVKEITDAAIEEVKVVDTNKVEVKLSQAVDAEKTTFEVKKGQDAVAVKATFNEEKTAVTLQSDVKLQAGEYTLNINGIKEEAITSTFKVEEEAYKSIKIASEGIQLKENAPLYFQILNQYGTEFKTEADNVLVNAYNVTEKKDIKAKVAADDKGSLYVQVEEANACKIGDEIRVTVTFKELTEQVTLPIIESAAISTIELKEVAPLEKTDRITVADEKLELPYELKDQYGKDVKLGNHEANADQAVGVETIDGVRFSSSDKNIIDVHTLAVADGKLTFKAGNTAGKVRITALIPATGKVSYIDVVVNEKAKLDKVTVEAPKELVVANEDVKLGLVAVDQYGKAVENLQGLKLESSDESVVANGDINVVDGQFIVKPLANNEAKEVTLTVKDAGKVLGTVNFKVNPTAEISTMEKVDLTAAYEKGGKDTLKYENLEVKDQYGRIVKLDNQEVKVEVKVEDPAVTVDKATINSADGEITFTGASDEDKEVVYTVSVGKAAKEITLKSVAQKSIDKYFIESKATTLYANEAHNAENKYAVEVALRGMVGETEVALNQENVKKYTTSDAEVIDVKDNKIFAKKAGEATISVFVGAEKLADIKVNATDVAPVATTVEFENEKVTVAAEKNVTNKLTVKDQYGVELDAEAVDATFTSSNKEIATVNKDGQVTGVKEGEAVISYVTKNGIAKTYKVVVTPKAAEEQKVEGDLKGKGDAENHEQGDQHKEQLEEEHEKAPKEVVPEKKVKSEDEESEEAKRKKEEEAQQAKLKQEQEEQAAAKLKQEQEEQEKAKAKLQEEEEAKLKAQTEHSGVEEHRDGAVSSDSESH